MLEIVRRIVRGSFVLLGTVLAACAPKTDVSMTGNAPAQYTHLFLTTQQIWLNASATAAAQDTSWIKFPLATPVTLDLLSATNGTLAQLTTGLSLPAGTYAQVRLLAVDPGASLLASASSAGALYNAEVDYIDSAGKTHQNPLELLNPDQGIGIETSLAVTAAVSTTGLGMAANTAASTAGTGLINGGLFTTGTSPTATTGSSTSTNTAGETTGITPSATVGTNTSPTTGLTNTTTSPTGLTGQTGTTSTTTASTASPFAIDLNLDGSRDLVPFTYGTTLTGMLLNPHLTAYAEAAVGAIQGALTITGLTNLTNAAGHVGIEVTAETLSSDGTRHVAVNSAQVNPDGTFVLYPLPTSSSNAATYDLVIHGPQIATIIVQSVPVNVGSAATTTPVTIGTLLPRAAAGFPVNLTPGSAPLQAGALVGFYQTLPGPGAVPYLIEQWPIDPFNRNFAADQTISAGNIDFGAFVAGANIALATAKPTEGAGTYRVGATAPLFTDGPLTMTVSGSASIRRLISLPPLAVAAGAVADSISVAVSAPAGKYDQGELIVSHDGAVVATASLGVLLTQGAAGTIAIGALPGGTSSSAYPAGLYDLSARIWSSTHPASTLSRQAFAVPADLRTGSVTGLAAAIN